MQHQGRWALAAGAGGLSGVLLAGRRSQKERFDRLLAAEAARHGLSPSEWFMQVLSRDVAAAKARRAGLVEQDRSRIAEGQAPVVSGPGTRATAA